MLVCIVACAGLTYGASEPAAQKPAPFNDVRAVLTDIQTAVDKSRTALTAGDVSSMDVTYATGKMLEDFRQTGIKTADKAALVINALRLKPTLFGYFELYDALDGLNETMNNLVLFTTSGDDRVVKWIADLSDASIHHLMPLIRKWFEETRTTLAAEDILQGRSPYAY